MNRRCLVLLVSLLALCLCGSAAAQVQVSFPLQRHYRPGEYLPVRITADASVTGPVVLRAHGAVRLSVETRPGGTDVVVPWLAVGDVREVTWSAPGGAGGAVDGDLAPLEPRQVLVGVAGASIAAAVEAATPLLFPGQGIVPVSLPGAPPLRGDVRAWEALDVIVFDESPGEAALAELLAAGVSVVVRSADPPAAGGWAWQGERGRWFVSFNPAGPSGAIVPEAYEVVSTWNPGWPAPLRRRVMLLAVIFCILAAGASLWRPARRAAVAVVAVAFCAAGGFAVWASRQSQISEVATGITVEGPHTTQLDHWHYVRPLRPGEIWSEWGDYGKPVFASLRHLRGADLELRCGDGGRPSGFAWRAGRGMMLALLARTYTPQTSRPDQSRLGAPVSPLRDFAREHYTSPGDRVFGDQTGGVAAEDAEWSQYWPGVIILRQPAPK